MMALFTSEWEFTTFCFYLTLIWWGDRLILHSLGMILGYFQHHRERTSSILNQGFFKLKGATGNMRFLLYSSSVAMGLVRFTLKMSRMSLPEYMSLVTSSDCPQLLHSKYCLQWVSVKKFYLLNCFWFAVFYFFIYVLTYFFCSYFFHPLQWKLVLLGDVFHSIPDE